MKKVLLASMLFGVSSVGFAADRLAECTIGYAQGDNVTVNVAKYPGEMPADEQHLTTILTLSNGLVYEVAETFDGSGEVGIGRGRLANDHSVTFEQWSFAELPLHVSDVLNDVWISCKE